MLDEIGEMKPRMQGKLLHVLQDGEFSRLGSNKRVPSTCESSPRRIAISRRCSAKSEFREDLLRSAEGDRDTVPPLRERQDEIPHADRVLLREYAKRYNRRDTGA